ncbi:MAG: DNA adenine methylase [Dehalococcoidia bacterium]
MQRPNPQPVLKWAGGKTQILPQILALAPARFQTYYEPFAGSAAVFFALAGEGRFQRAVLADRNAELLGMYRVIKDDLPTLVSHLREHEEQYLRADSETRRSYFYKVRAQDPAMPLVRPPACCS